MKILCAYEFKRSLAFPTVTYCFKLVFLTSKPELSSRFLFLIANFQGGSKTINTLKIFLPWRNENKWHCESFSRQGLNSMALHSPLVHILGFQTTTHMKRRSFSQSLTNFAIKIIFNKSILHRMIIFVLLYRFCLSFGLMSTPDKSISINTLITDFAKYLQDLSQAAIKTKQIDGELKVKYILVQKLQ